MNGGTETESGSRTTEAWFGAEGEVSRLRGLMFKAGCLGATLLALLLMLTFLLYVFNDAFRPFSADIGWLATVFLTVALPALALTAYYYRRDPRGGEVAYIALGLPIASALFAGGVVIVFRHIIAPQSWLALLVTLILSAGALELHSCVRRAGVVERFVLATIVLLFALVGIPAFHFDYSVVTFFTHRELVRFALSTPEILPSLWELIYVGTSILTAEFSALVSFTVPLVLLAGWYVRRVRESDRVAAIVAGSPLGLAMTGLVLAPIVGLPTLAWIVLATVVGVPVSVYAEHVVRRGTGIAGFLFPVVIVAGAVLGYVIARSFGFAGPEPWLDWQFLTSPHSRDPTDAGFYPPLVGSVMMLIVIALAAFPVGVGAAIYLEEYAPNRGRIGMLVELIEINIANLAGVPSVVYGVLGLALFVRTLGMRSGIVIVGGLTIGLLILPIVIVSAQEAIRAVPGSLREASYGMGATKWQTTRNVVLPRAMPGILTGTILSLGRAVGETAPLLMIGAAAVVRVPPDSFFSKFSAMPRQIFTWSTEIQAEFRYGVLAAGVVTLLVVLLMMNGTAIVLRNKYQRKG